MKFFNLHILKDSTLRAIIKGVKADARKSSHKHVSLLLDNNHRLADMVSPKKLRRK